MGAINISINSNITTDLRNNLFTFKKYGIPIYSIPVPNHYQIIMNLPNTFIIKKKKNTPTWIPRGYSYLTINQYGFFQIESKQKDPTGKSKRLFFVDTREVTPQDIYKASNYTFQQENFKIPNSFWFYPDYLYQEESPSWLSIKQAKTYYDDFDPQNGSRIMTELECLSLYAEHCNQEEFIESGIIPYHDENIDISYQEFNFDNWFNPVSSSEKKKEYRKIYKSGPLYQNEPLPETEVTSLYLTPTIRKK